MAYQKINNINFDIFILSSETNSVVKCRANKLGLKVFDSTKNKFFFLKNYFDKKLSKNVNPFEGLIYLGNDLNDLQVMKKAKFSFAPSDAHPIIKKAATFVLPQKGGEGFIRNFFELILGIDLMTEEEIIELISYC